MTPRGLQHGKLYVFEGIDGSGKTTLSKELLALLSKQSPNVHYFSFPGHEEGTLGRHVYKIHHDLKTAELINIHPTSLQMLHIAAHIDSVVARIIPLLKKGHTIILDRYWWSAWAYGIAAGIDPHILEHMVQCELFYWGKIKPTALFLLKRSPVSAKQVVRAVLSKVYKQLLETERGQYPIFEINTNRSTKESVAILMHSLHQLIAT